MKRNKTHWHKGCPVGVRTDSGKIHYNTLAFVESSKANPDWFCVTCASKARLALAAESAPKPSDVDSDRYAELRKLVEAWQTAYRQNDKAQTKNNPITEVWLKHWLNLCDAQKPLLDWRHR